ncbi:putative ribonuclease H-like domain-containing protein [Tanacetum coccineum]
MCYGVYLDNQHVPHQQMLLVQWKESFGYQPSPRDPLEPFEKSLDIRNLRRISSRVVGCVFNPLELFKLVHVVRLSGTYKSVQLLHIPHPPDSIQKRSLPSICCWTKVDMSNISTTYPVSSTPNIRIHKDHSLAQEKLMRPFIMSFACFLSQEEPKEGFYTQEEGIDYDEVFAPVARIEAIRLFLAYASFKYFVVYQMHVKSSFLYGKIEEGVYVCQPPGFEDLGLQVTQKDDGIFISQDKYVDEILKKFGFSTVKTASTPMETSKPLMKDENAEDVDVHLYRSMIGSLMYLTSSRPDIMFVVCACARFQVTPKVSHLHAVKRIFRYLKGQPKLGLWYPKDSPFDLEAYTDSDYAGASLDRKSTTGGCQFLRSRLISWQCKKQTIVANSTTEAEYVAAASCCGQVLWIQNQMLDYGYNFMNTKIFIDNESTICIVKNPVFHSKTKHIEIRHHFIRDSNEKKLIQMIKIHTDQNVADLLTKAFDVGRFQYLIATANDEIQVSVVGLTYYCAKTTAWNEFSSTMASVVIYLATNQKFNFSKYIFDNMVKNLEGGVKFLMYLRFVQVFLDKQVEGMTKHKEIYVTPSHTKKVFANMKRGGKGFSGRVTPLFQTMMVQAQEEGEGSIMPTVPQHTPTINPPSTSKPQKKQSRRKQRKDTEVSQPSDPTEPMADETKNVESVPKHSNDPLLSGEDRLKLNELMELCTKLSERVLDLENTKTSQAAKITKLKERVKMLERRNKSRTPGLKRLRKVGRSAQVVSSEDEGLDAQEDASKQGRKIVDLDVDAKEVEVEKTVSTAEVSTASATTTTIDELTLAQTLIEIKAAKPKAVTTAATTTTTTVTRPKARGVIVQEPSEFRTTTSSSQTSQLQQDKDKGKAKMIKPEKPLKKKDQILIDEEIAQKL